MSRFAAVVAVLITTATASVGNGATAAPRYELSVRVDAEARTVEGHARIGVTNDTAAPVGELWLWRYPERFAARSKALNDYNFWWIYPYSFNAGHMRASAVAVDGRAVPVEVHDHPLAGKGTLLRVALDPPLAAGGSVIVDVDFRDEVPSRFGAFGCVHGNCTLTGFYPMVAPLGAGRDAMPGRGVYTLSVATAHVADVVVNGELRALE